MKNIIKEILKLIYKLSAITYPYVIFLKIANIPDEITILSSVFTMIYAVISIILFNWCYEEK